VRQTRTPDYVAPAGACDSHFHIFGPYDRFPLSAARGYTPPEALVADYLRMRTTLRLSRSVIVQPSVYGADNECTLDAIQHLGGTARCRAVAVIDEGAPGGFDGAHLRRMHEAGVRGVRFNVVDGGGPDVAEMERISRLIAPLGWHIQLFLPSSGLVGALPVLQGLPVEIVIDHLGRADPARGLDDPAFQALLRLLDGGRAWVKLSGYLSSALSAPFADVAPFVQKLVAIRPDRLVWGSNWPHPVRYRDMPNDGDLLDALATWISDEATMRRILVANPARLYGFPETV
jgi:predicted TIM-barrel fold metal-dependent hydrolase